MGNKDFHEKPYDEGSLAKLRIFELYAQEWIPVFLARRDPKFKEVHIFDFFCGPGSDSKGVYGSPLRILNRLRGYYDSKSLAGWGKIPIVAHFFDDNKDKIGRLNSILHSPEWNIPGVQLDCRPLAFQDALPRHKSLLSNAGIAKLLIIDPYGIGEVSDLVFKDLIHFVTTDFIFFLPSSTLHRFRNDPAIKQKIEKPEDSFDVHRAAVNYYRKLIPGNERFFLGSFSIRKRTNIYGLIFGSRHPLGIHKFLEVAWKEDEFAGEANFDIERENILPGELILALDEMRPKKLRGFEGELESSLRAGKMKSEADIFRFCIEAGMRLQHSAPVLKKLKAERIIDLDFRVPDVRRLSSPRPIRINE